MSCHAFSRLAEILVWVLPRCPPSGVRLRRPLRCDGLTRMEACAFGQTGLAVSMLGMGCGRLGSAGSREARRDAEATVDRSFR